MVRTRPETQPTSADNRISVDDSAEALATTGPPARSRRLNVGFIVAASLIIGFVVAVFLVVVAFAGARENVISGTAMLGFALGWGLLAMLSVRWSNQPQPWAAVPATLMALTGVVFLLWSHIVVINVLGWLWPPTLLALVVWMIVQARRQLHSRSGSLLLYPVFGALALVSLGGGYETVSETLDRSASAMPGQMIDVGGFKLYIECTGVGSPTVLLEAGLGEPSSDIGGWIAPSVAQNTRVCVYDRAGRGRSEAAPGPQDGIAVATDLHTLLDRDAYCGAIRGRWSFDRRCIYAHLRGTLPRSSRRDGATRLTAQRSVHWASRLSRLLLPLSARVSAVPVVRSIRRGAAGLTEYGRKSAATVADR